jgi:hypothetical protein
MRNIVAKLVFGVAITTIGMYGADNSIGTWKRNLEKSKSSTPVTNPITSLTIVYEAVDGGVKTTVTGQHKDGTAINSTSTIKYDGKEYPVTGAPWDTTSVKQIDANTFTFESRKTGGKYHITGRTVISKDGKTMTTSTKGTNSEGKPISAKAVYDKQDSPSGRNDRGLARLPRTDGPTCGSVG